MKPQQRYKTQPWKLPQDLSQGQLEDTLFYSYDNWRRQIFTCHRPLLPWWHQLSLMSLHKMVSSVYLQRANRRSSLWVSTITTKDWILLAPREWLKRESVTNRIRPLLHKHIPSNLLKMGLGADWYSFN